MLLYALVALVMFWAQARASAWGKLLERYRDEGPLAAPRRRFQFGRLGSLARRRARHWGTLTVGLGPQGLQLRAALPLRFAYPSLLIPWDEVQTLGPVGWFGLSHELRLGRTGETLRVGPSLARSIQAAQAIHQAKRAPAFFGSAQLRASTQRCPYCHDGFAGEAVEVCAHCDTPHHAACLREHGGCAVHACRGGALVRAG